MAKAVAVMDMPDRCDDCDLWDYDRETDLSYCGSWSGRGRLDDTSSKPDWCPLIKLPDRNPDREVLFSGKSFTLDEINDAFKLGEDTGWNAFIDYLEGKNENNTND